MRIRLLAPLVALCLVAVAGCGDDAPATTPDMAVAAADMSVARDMATKTCLQVATCVAGCGATGAACVQACTTGASASAATLYMALVGCGYTECLKPQDGGAAACTSATDTSAGCAMCVAAKAQTPACQTQLGACLAG